MDIGYFKYSPLLLILVLLGCSDADHKAEKMEAVLEYRISSQLGEGPVWNHKTGELLWVDIEGKLLHIYNPATGVNRSLPTPSRAGTVVPSGDDEVLVALEDGIYTMHTQTGQTQLFCSIEADMPWNRFNDGKCDPAGRLWVGSMDFGVTNPTANLYRVDADGKATKMLDSITISNGIVWSGDQKTMYYIDTPTGVIRAYDFDVTTGEISNGRVAVAVPESLGAPDGMAIDEEDMLWVGMWNGNCVARFNPLTGELISRLEVPAHNVTACAFGGKDLDTLYITTAALDMTEEEAAAFPDAGSLFIAVPGVKGVRSPFFGKNSEKVN